MVQHRFITDVDKHEPIGIEDATSGQIYVADGAGSGAWSDVSTPIPGAIFQDQKSAGTNGGSFSHGADRTRTLNTSVRNVISGASLSSNRMILPAGTYYFQWSAPAEGVNNHQSWLYNVTDATVVAPGSTCFASSSNNGASHSLGYAVVTIASQKSFEIRHRCETSQTSTGFGSAANVGQTEVYTSVQVWKEA